MQYDHAFFDAGVKRAGTRCEKWDDPAVCGHDDLAMWVADWDFCCAQPIVEALKRRAEHPCYGYSCADPKDQQAFCAYWLRRHGALIRPEETAMLPCVITGLKLSVLAFTKPGEGVAYMPPVYGPFGMSVECNERAAAVAPLLRDAEARYHINYEGLEDVLRGGARLVLFCSPHNPVSRVWSMAELTRLVALCNQYHAVLVSDEIHADITFRGHDFIPMLNVPGADDCVIALASASKTFNIPGLQQAMAVSRNKALLDALKRQAACAGVTSGNTFALTATQAAYTACDDWLDGMLDYLQASKGIVEADVARLLPRAVLTPIEATCLAWLDMRAYSPSTEQLLQKAKEKRVVLTGGTFFGRKDGDGFVRLNFGCPHAQLREGIRRLAQAMEG